jgi:hypothetical protein
LYSKKSYFFSALGIARGFSSFWLFQTKSKSTKADEPIRDATLHFQFSSLNFYTELIILSLSKYAEVQLSTFNSDLTSHTELLYWASHTEHLEVRRARRGATLHFQFRSHISHRASRAEHVEACRGANPPFFPKNHNLFHLKIY